MPTTKRTWPARAGAGLLAALLAGSALADPVPPRQVDVRAQFSLFDPRYRERIKPWRQRVAALAKSVQALERAGRSARCAEQVLAELRWRAGNTADYAAIAAEADRLGALLASPPETAAPARQDPSDGSWGGCYTEWFFRLDASYDVISTLGRETPPLPAHFLDRINDPDSLQRYLEGAMTSVIARDGINRRREYNLALADLMRLILKGKPAGYAWHPDLKARLKALLYGPLRDPETATWGPMMMIDVRPLRVPDVSVTFHVVKYLGGDVPDWPKLIDTLLSIRSLRYPQGWTEDDGFLAHDLYDVATLLRLGWPHADAAQRPAIVNAMGEMLDWCLVHTVHPDGSITVDENDDSIETATYFAVSLLDELGYFDPAKRFWTDRAIAGTASLAGMLRARIEAALATGAAGEGGSYYRAALARLDGRAP